MSLLLLQHSQLARQPLSTEELEALDHQLLPEAVVNPRHHRAAAGTTGVGHKQLQAAGQLARVSWRTQVPEATDYQR